MLQVNDLVTVVSEPRFLKQFGKFVGRDGFIVDISAGGKRVLFQGLRLDGHFDGTIWLPVKSLVPDASVRWKAAFRKYRLWMSELVSDMEERNLKDAQLSY